MALAGNGTSGGGGAFVCRDADQNIKSSHLLDLWEAKKIFKLDIVISNDSVEAQIAQALAKLASADPLLAAKTAEYIPILFLNARQLDDDISLPAPEDAANRYQMRGCPLEGMMFYDGDFDQLQISPSVFDKLATNTDLAAAKIHEAVYYVIRNSIVENSDRVIDQTSKAIRKLVGCLFSTNKECLSPTLSKEQIIASSDSVYYCQNSEMAYYLVKNNNAIQSSMPRNCELFGVNRTTEEWLGLFDKIKDHTFLAPAFFVKELSRYPFPIMDRCSILDQYNFSTLLLVERNNNDAVDNHPLLTNFTSRGDLAYVYGTPTCEKIK